MLDLDNGLKVRDNFFDLSVNNIILNKEIKKEAEKENISQDDTYFQEWYLFENSYDQNKTAIDLYLEKDLSEDEKFFVENFKNYVLSIFKVKKDNGEDYVLLNLINNQKYCVKKDSTDQNLDIGEYVLARLIPFDTNNYFFTNTLCKINIESNDQIYSILAQFELDYPHSAFTDNKNKIESSYKIQELEYQDFVEFFGSDEIIVSGDEITEKLHEFYHYRYFQKKDKNTGKTIAKIFREKYGSHPSIPSIDLPTNLMELDEVGIVYDVIEGLNFLPWYGVFKEIFRNENFKEIPGYKECVNEYLKSDTISSLPFKKVMREFPENTVKVIKEILNRKRFNIPEDFNKLMVKYKQKTITRSLEPTLIPMPERTKALLRAKKTEEFSGLHFYEVSKKYRNLHKYC